MPNISDVFLPSSSNSNKQYFYELEKDSSGRRPKLTWKSWKHSSQNKHNNMKHDRELFINIFLWLQRSSVLRVRKWGMREWKRFRFAEGWGGLVASEEVEQDNEQRTLNECGSRTNFFFPVCKFEWVSTKKNVKMFFLISFVHIFHCFTVSYHLLHLAGEEGAEYHHQHMNKWWTWTFVYEIH